MQTGRLVFQNSVLNFVAGVSQRIGQTVTFILVARLLTAESTGAFKLATTYTSILLTLSLWGLDQLLIRDVAKDRANAARYLGNFLLLRLLLGIGAWLILAAVLPVLPYAPESKQLILIMAASVIPGSLSNLYQSVWIAYEDVRAISAILLGFSLVRVAGAALLLLQASPLTAVAYLFLLVAVGELALNALITHRYAVSGGIRWQLDLGFWVDNLRAAVPLILVSIILLVEYQFDDIILSLFYPEAEVGVYGTAATVLALLLFLTRSYQMAVFPVLARAQERGLDYLRRIYALSMGAIVLAALPVTVFVSLLAGPIIRLIFGPGYEAAGDILRVLTWAFFISAFNVANSRLLIAVNRQRMLAIFALMSMSGNLVLSLLLVPQFGGVGTAWARVLGMPLYTIPALWYVQSRVCRLSWRDWRALLRLRPSISP